MSVICLGLNGFASSEVVHGTHFELDEILAHAKELQYDGIELFPFHARYPNTAGDQRALKAHYEAYGLAIPALQSEVHGHASSPQRESRDAYVESIKFNLDLALNLGSHVVGVWSGSPLPDIAPDEQVRWAEDTYRRCAELAEEAEITLALEPEPVQVVDSLSDLLTVLDGVGSPRMTAIFDFAHVTVLSSGHPDEFLAAIAGRIGHVHLTDSDGKQLWSGAEGASHTSRHLAVGDGNLDMAGLVRALYDTGYAGWIQVDVWEHPDPYRASRLGKRFLDSSTGGA